MTDLLFGDSAAGGLKHSRVAKEVLPLTLALDVGDISAAGGLTARRAAIDKLYGAFDTVPDALWAQNEKTLERLKSPDIDGLRIWVGRSDPAELCGLYYMCRLLLDSPIPLSVVALPEMVETEHGITQYRGTGELPPEAFKGMLTHERPVSDAVKRACASMWSDLTVENAALRALVNGQVVSVPESFYDFALRKNLPDEPVSAARVIGKTLIEMPGVSDRWLFLRLENMLRRGDLIEVSPASADHPYSAILQKAD